MFECLNVQNGFKHSDLNYSNLFRVSRFDIRDLSGFHFGGQSGQSMVEFTFAMMATLILIFALLMVFRWAGMDLAERRFAHEDLLTDNTLRPEQQLNPDFFKPRKIGAAFRGFDLK